MSTVYLSLGSNLGDRRAYLDKGIELLRMHDRVDVVQSSSYYETEPIGYTDQGWFLNAALEVQTALTPQQLLAYCQSVERQSGRRRAIRWGPRTLDIDLLLYHDYESKEPNLLLPHPRMHERACVLIPLREIAPNLTIRGNPIGDLIVGLPSHLGSDYPGQITRLSS